MPPSLADVLHRLGRERIEDIRIVPLFFAEGAHVRDDLPRLVADARRAYPALNLVIDPAIGEQEAVLQAIAAAIAGE